MAVKEAMFYVRIEDHKTQEVKKSLILINQVIRLNQICSKYIFNRFYLM